jgi:hypothetical protein
MFEGEKRSVVKNTYPQHMEFPTPTNNIDKIGTLNQWSIAEIQACKVLANRKNSMKK